MLSDKAKKKAERRYGDLEEYRNLMDVPGEFKEGFSISSLIGVLFLALVMIPGSLYMELVAGMGVGPAAQWVTVILFVEIAKRANATLSRSQLFVLFYMAGSIVRQSVFGMPLFTQFLVNSDAAINYGLADQFPDWVAPKNLRDLPRTFFQVAWLPAIALVAFRMFIGKIDNAVLGYGLFRMASDHEKLPFPMAAVGAQGMMVLAEETDGVEGSEGSWKWRAFGIGGALGMVFSFLYIGLPSFTGALFDSRVQIFPIPFVDLTTKTQSILPAVATGLSFNFGQLVLGMVMPFYAMLGSFIGLICTFIANPIMHHYHVLYTWQPGMSTVETIFSNRINFYFSFSIGTSLAIAIVGIVSAIRKGQSMDASQKKSIVPEGRGDIPNLGILLVYTCTTTILILLSGWLVGWHKGVMVILLFYGFFYTPLVSYVTARLEGIAGQVFEIPFIRELSFILSGYQGVAIWFIPVPKANYGYQTVFYRQAELTGTKFTSIWKADLILFPVIIISMITFSSFIYSLREIPSEAYPFTQVMWQFMAKNRCLMLTATSGEYSVFSEALNGGIVGVGFVFGLILFGTIGFFAAPMTICYGLVRGLNQTLPHIVIPQFIGALLGRFYFKKRFGDNWRKYITVVAAGYWVGAGLMPMLSVGLIFLAKATKALPY
jgi:hypothetical protein